MKTRWAVAFGVLCGFLLGGLLFLVTSQPRGQAIPLIPAPSPIPLTIYITGAVAQPGLYSLPPSCRVSDAIHAAGGFLPDADSTSLNLAAPLKDGQHIRVPQINTNTPPEGEAVTQPAANRAIPEFPINLNTANQVELESLPEIGPALALAIIQYRDENGPFETVEEIQKVPGIGPAIYAAIKELITVE